MKTIEHSGRISVKDGTVLFVPFSDTLSETPKGTVNINAHAVVLVSCLMPD